MSGRLYAIGDIHGCAAELDTLLAGIPLGAGDTLVFVGDYIDRGPDSAGVVARLIELGARRDVATVFLRGNHEDMALAWMGRPGRWGEAWSLNGGAAALRSWGIPPGTPGREVACRLPPAHLAFLEDTTPYAVRDRWLMVHAGIRPGRRLEAQDPEDLYWIREEFIARPHELPYTVVFGHTPQRTVLVDVPWKIGIDTGCVYGGRLTALEVREQRLWQVRAGERQVRDSRLAAS